MKKTTPLKLTKRLTQYSALSLAFGGLADANGQIIYSGIVNVGSSPNQTYQLDLNGSTADFYLRAGSGSYGLVDVLPENGGNAILGRYVNSANIFPYALGYSYTISAGNSWWQSNNIYQKLNNLNCNPVSNSYWCGVTDKFLGLRFKIGIDTHYGWARLDVSLSGDSWLLKDYAYEATPDASIDTPDELLGVNDELVAKVKIVALNKSIALYNLPETTSYKIYSMTGQSVLDGKIENNTFVIEAKTMSSGVYIIELEDTTTKAIMRKKIVL